MRTRQYLTPEEFKTLFKVGDILYSRLYSTEIKITAIGEKTFLYKFVDPGYGTNYKPEKSFAMNAASGFMAIIDGKKVHPCSLLDSLKTSKNP